jgi:hypothetical protein
MSALAAPQSHSWGLLWAICLYILYPYPSIPRPLSGCLFSTAQHRLSYFSTWLERADIAFAQPSRSSSLFDRVIQTSGDSASSHHALTRGVWTKLQWALHRRGGVAAGRAECLTLVIMNGQSIKTTDRGESRSLDGDKRVKGRKRHILVDTLGLPIASRAEPANTWDR